jgi:hypothetical protein
MRAVSQIIDDQDGIDKRPQPIFPAAIDRVMVDNQPVRIDALQILFGLSSILLPRRTKPVLVLHAGRRQIDRRLMFWTRQWIDPKISILDSIDLVTIMQPADEVTFGTLST